MRHDEAHDGEQHRHRRAIAVVAVPERGAAHVQREGGRITRVYLWSARGTPNRRPDRAADAEDEGREKDGQRHRQDDVAEQPHGPGPIDASGLDDVIGDVQASREDQHPVEADRAPDVHDDDHDEGGVASAEPVGRGETDIDQELHQAVRGGRTGRSSGRGSRSPRSVARPEEHQRAQ